MTRSVIDVGCAELIINGQVKVEYGSEVDHLEPSKVILKNGTKLDADSIILACAPFVYPISYIWLTDPWESRTGWKGVRTKLRDTFGDDVIDVRTKYGARTKMVRYVRDTSRLANLGCVSCKDDVFLLDADCPSFGSLHI